MRCDPIAAVPMCRRSRNSSTFISIIFPSLDDNATQTNNGVNLVCVAVSERFESCVNWNFGFK